MPALCFPQPVRQRSPPHAGDHAHCGVQRQDGAAAVAEKGEGQADDRHDEQAHADIFHRLEDQHGPEPHADQRVHAALRQPRRLETAVDHQKFQHDDNKAPHQTQLLAADAEDKVRLPGGEAAFAPLGLDALKQPLTEQAPAAQGQHPPALLVADIPRADVGVVEDHVEPVHPVLGQLLKQRQPPDAQPQRAEAQGEPIPCQPRRQGHARVDDQIHEAAARVLGNDVDPHEHEPRVRRGKNQRPQALHLPVVPEPGDLLGQQHRKGQAHDLRRLDHGGQSHVQPGAVAAALPAQGRAQQGDKPDVKEQEQPPFFRKMLHIDVGKNEVRANAQHCSGGLDQDPPELGARILIVQVAGGAGDQHKAEGRTHHAQPQQLHIRLAHDILYGLPHPFENGHSISSREMIPVSLPHNQTSVNHFRDKIPPFPKENGGISSYPCFASSFPRASGVPVRMALAQPSSKR